MKYVINAAKSVEDLLICCNCKQSTTDLFTLGSCEDLFCQACCKQFSGEICPECGLFSHAKNASQNRSLSTVASLCKDLLKTLRYLDTVYKEEGENESVVKKSPILNSVESISCLSQKSNIYDFVSSPTIGNKFIGSRFSGSQSLKNYRKVCNRAVKTLTTPRKSIKLKTKSLRRNKHTQNKVSTSKINSDMDRGREEDITTVNNKTFYNLKNAHTPINQTSAVKKSSLRLTVQGKHKHTQDTIETTNPQMFGFSQYLTENHNQVSDNSHGTGVYTSELIEDLRGSIEQKDVPCPTTSGIVTKSNFESPINAKKKLLLRDGKENKKRNGSDKTDAVETEHLGVIRETELNVEDTPYKKRKVSTKNINTQNSTKKSRKSSRLKVDIDKVLDKFCNNSPVSSPSRFGTHDEAVNSFPVKNITKKESKTLPNSEFNNDSTLQVTSHASTDATLDTVGGMLRGQPANIISKSTTNTKIISLNPQAPRCSNADIKINGPQQISNDIEPQVDLYNSFSNAHNSTPRSIRRVGKPSVLTTPTSKSHNISSLSVSPTIQTPSHRPMDKKNAKGETKLHVASIKGKIDQVRELLTAGANPNIQDHAGWTALHEACNHGHTNIARLLLQNGACINVLGGGNDTPLHDAVANNRLECVKLLVEYGASLTMKNSEGLVPSDYAQTDMMKQALVAPPMTAKPAAINLGDPEDCFGVTILGTSLTREQCVVLRKCASLIHAVVVDNFSTQVTHVVTSCNADGQCPRTLKYLQAVLSGKWIVSFDWVLASLDYKKRVVEGGFEVPGSSTNPNTHAARSSRLNTNQHFPGLFAGCSFYFLGPFKYPTPSTEELSSLAVLGGGTVLKREPKLWVIKCQPSTSPYHVRPDAKYPICNTFIVYDTDMRNKIHDPRLCCVSAWWLMKCIATFALLDPV